MHDFQVDATKYAASLWQRTTKGVALALRERSAWQRRNRNLPVCAHRGAWQSKRDAARQAYLVRCGGCGLTLCIADSDLYIYGALVAELGVILRFGWRATMPRSWELRRVVEADA